METVDCVKEAHQAWEAAFCCNRNAIEADAALSPFTVSSWTMGQLLELGKLVFGTLESGVCEVPYKGEEMDEDELDESRACEGCHEEEEFDESQTEFEEGAEAEPDVGNAYVMPQDEYTFGIRFSILLCHQAGDKPKLLRRLLYGIAAGWGHTGPVSEDGYIYECPEFAVVLGRWYQMYHDLEAGKALASALIKVDKWAPKHLEQLWCERAGSEFLPVWRAFTMPEMGQLFRTAVRNERLPLSSYYNNDSESESDDEFDADDDEEEFEEGPYMTFVCLSEQLRLNPAQQKEFLVAGAKGLFYPETLAKVLYNLEFPLTTEEFWALAKKQTPAMKARFRKELSRGEAIECDNSPEPSSRIGANYLWNSCRDDATRGCLRQRCNTCCEWAPEGPCAVHQRIAPPASKAPKAGQCVGMGEGFATGFQAPFVQPSNSHVPQLENVEPIYTAAETRVVKSAEDLLGTGGGGMIKTIVFSDFEVTDVHLLWLGVVVGASLERLEISGGKDHQLSGEAVAGLAAACPKLKKFIMESASQVKDTAFAAILRACPDLEHLEICGNDKVPGQITDKSLKLLIKDATLVPQLRKLRVVDQYVTQNVAAKVMKTRPLLSVNGGESGSDGYAQFMVMQAMARCSYKDGLWEMGPGAKKRGFNSR